MSVTSVTSCARCTFRRPSGQQCKRRTCKYGPFCWQHTYLTQHVEVRPSTVAGAGLGLFARKDFPAGTAITTYEGDTLTKAQVEARYPGDTVAPYTIASGSCFIDACKSNAGMGRYANDGAVLDREGADEDAVNAAHVDAAIFSRRGGRCHPDRHPYPVVTATKDIAEGDEIFVSYGGQYWAPRGPRDGGNQDGGPTDQEHQEALRYACKHGVWPPGVPYYKGGRLVKRRRLRAAKGKQSKKRIRKPRPKRKTRTRSKKSRKKVKRTKRSQ